MGHPVNTLTIYLPRQVYVGRRGQDALPDAEGVVQVDDLVDGLVGVLLAAPPLLLLLLLDVLHVVAGKHAGLEAG